MLDELPDVGREVVVMAATPVGPLLLGVAPAMYLSRELLAAIAYQNDCTLYVFDTCDLDHDEIAERAPIVGAG